MQIGYSCAPIHNIVPNEIGSIQRSVKKISAPRVPGINADVATPMREEWNAIFALLIKKFSVVFLTSNR